MEPREIVDWYAASDEAHGIGKICDLCGSPIELMNDAALLSDGNHVHRICADEAQLMEKAST